MQAPSYRTTILAVLTWMVLLIAGIALTGCGDNAAPWGDLPVTMDCTDYEALMVSVDDPVTVPSIVPAQAGVRIVVDRDVVPFSGASYAVPGGRMVWSVWIFRWYDGDHIGTIGVTGYPRCAWYGPVI